MRKFPKILLYLMLSIAFLNAQEREQSRGIISGTAVNSVTREPLAGVNVTLIGTTIGAATDLDGKFTIKDVFPGTYSVRASVLGYSPVVKSDIVVNPARPVTIDFELSETPIEVGEVSITAEYFQKSPDAPVSTQIQSSEEIRRLPGGFEDVVRAISILPGVAQVQAGRNDLIVRGGAPSENLYTIDNIEIPNINHFGTQGASGGPLSYVNLDYVNETSFSSGGFGVKYGDRLSSVLSIDLREGRTDRFGTKVTISATQFGLNAEGPLSDNGSYFFSARRSYLDLIFRAAGFSFVPEYWDFLGKAQYRLSSTDQLSVVGLVALDNVRLFNDTDEKIYDNSKILYSDQDQIMGGATWRHLFRSGYTTLTLSQISSGFRYRQNDTLLQPIFKNDSRESETSLRGDVVYQVEHFTEISFGLTGKLINFDSDITLRPFSTEFGQELSINAYNDTTALKTGAFMQVVQTVYPFKFTFGLRGDYFSLIEEGFVVAPRLSAAWTLSPLTNITFSLGRYYQAPSYIWLVSNESNRLLKHIAVNQYIAGVEHLLRSDTRVSLEAYIKDYFHYPVSELRPYLIMANTGAGYGGSREAFASFGIDPLVSRGSGEAYGVEFFLQKKLSEVPCYGIASLSYNVSRFRALDEVVRPNSFDQRWIINLGGGYVLDEKWEFAMKFRLATGRPYTPYNSDGTQFLSEYNTARIPVNHSLDVRIDRRWTFSKWTLVAYVDIQNIYNRKAKDVPTYNERTGQIEENSSIGILPSIGISAEF